MVKQHISEQVSLKTLHSDIKDGSIFLEPHYQRDVVWNQKSKSSLITTIINGFFIPQIIVREDNEEDIKECVDGKQRLTTIYNFMNNELCINHNGDNKFKFEDLSQKEQREFKKYKITLVELKGYTDDEIIEQFQKIQYGEKLTESELLYSRQDVMVVVELKKKKFNDLLKKFNGLKNGKFDNKRKQVFRIILICYAFLEKREKIAFNSTSTKISKVYKDIQVKINIIEKLYKNLQSIYNFLLKTEYTGNSRDIIHLFNIYMKNKRFTMKLVCKYYYEQKNKYETAEKEKTEKSPKNTEWFFDNRDAITQDLLNIREGLILGLLNEIRISELDEEVQEIDDVVEEIDEEVEEIDVELSSEEQAMEINVNQTLLEVV